MVGALGARSGLPPREPTPNPMILRARRGPSRRTISDSATTNRRIGAVDPMRRLVRDAFADAGASAD